jgi:4-diphosphocytidyl-2-C-methyl-D-erythritol kinase
MALIELRANAKINLSLDVLRKRADGYHDIQTVMQTINLHDKVLMETTKDGISVELKSRRIPLGPDNTAYKAAELMIKKYKLNKGLKILIDKKIPVAAGLAGGSADAAAVIKGINSLFQLKLSQEELTALGKSVGADVPFCLIGGTALAEGIGDELTALNSFEGFDIILLKPKVDVSTAWVYKNLDLGKIVKHPDTSAVLMAIENKDLNTLARHMGNVLEEVTIPQYPVVQQAKDKLMELGAAGCMMSGSGPSVFGFFTGGREAVLDAYNKTRDSRWYRFLAKTI